MKSGSTFVCGRSTVTEILRGLRRAEFIHSARTHYYIMKFAESSITMTHAELMDYARCTTSISAILVT